ncbi:unnamed protein product [Effrenium voratum]|uniref:Uncharacterized protein n=1 Tax=Effrenium voratum TaxID=2562239 RepID=A0AA36HN42_9DINO|nr:unnamed protein product [Effrenium voratum]
MHSSSRQDVAGVQCDCRFCHKHKQLVPACSSNALNVWQKLWDGRLKGCKAVMSVRKIWPWERRSLNVVANCGELVFWRIVKFACSCTPAESNNFLEPSAISGLFQMLQFQPKKQVLVCLCDGEARLKQVLKIGA